MEIIRILDNSMSKRVLNQPELTSDAYNTENYSCQVCIVQLIRLAVLESR